MSSHHIVKDMQEPALIIANGESCSVELLGQLLEWSPLVIVLDGAVYRVLELGIKIDVLLGDFDRIHNFGELLQHQQPIEVIHTPDQFKTDLEKAIDFVIARGGKAANIVWATGRRADHTITNLTNLVRYKDRINLVLFDDYSRVYRLPQTFTKWYAKGTIISLIPVGEVQGIKTSGLLYNLQNESLTLGYRTGSSNVVPEDGLVSITYTSGDLLMMECND
ncbi:MAG: thiamine diphosphokinase [Bacteroidia bacterium]|nr:thiamine diphosphokinase [Bacteroidia bacterium]